MSWSEALQASLRTAGANDVFIDAVRRAADVFAQAAIARQAESELRLWEKIKNSTEISDYDSFLQAFPDSALSPLARKKRADLRISQATQPIEQALGEKRFDLAEQLLRDISETVKGHPQFAAWAAKVLEGKAAQNQLEASKVLVLVSDALSKSDCDAADKALRSAAPTSQSEELRQRIAQCFSQNPIASDPSARRFSIFYIVRVGSRWCADCQYSRKNHGWPSRGCGATLFVSPKGVQMLTTERNVPGCQERTDSVILRDSISEVKQCNMYYWQGSITNEFYGVCLKSRKQEYPFFEVGSQDGGANLLQAFREVFQK